MEKSNKFKLFIGLVYLILICLFLYFLFSKFSLQEITSYDFLKNNREYFFELKNSNLILIFFIFFDFSINLDVNNKILYLLFIYLITIKSGIYLKFNHNI